MSSKLPIRIAGRLTGNDAIAALRAAGKLYPWKVLVIMLGFMVVVVGVVVAEGGRAEPTLAFVVLGGLWVMFALWRRGRVARSVAARPELQQPVTWVFSEEGLFIETSVSKTLHAWGAFSEARITPQMIILARHGGEMFHFVPRRFF